MCSFILYSTISLFLPSPSPPASPHLFHHPLPPLPQHPLPPLPKSSPRAPTYPSPSRFLVSSSSHLPTHHPPVLSPRHLASLALRRRSRSLSPVILAWLVPLVPVRVMVTVTGPSWDTVAVPLLQFNQFCDRFQIPETKCMPASYVLLSSFIADHSGFTSGATIRNWLNGLQLWHVTNGAEWYGKHSWVAALIKTAEKEGIVFRRPPRNPITLDYLRALRNHLDLSKPLHAAIWASAVIAFWACRRLGELFPKSNSLFNPTTDTS